MKKENLVYSENIDLLFNQNQGQKISSKNKIDTNKECAEYIKKNKSKFFFIFIIIFIFGFSSYIKGQNINLTMFINKIKQQFGYKERIDELCEKIEPLYLFKLRLETEPIKLCENKNNGQNHICYMNKFNDYFYLKNGVTCTMNNIIIDPSKSSQTNILYKGPVDQSYRGAPILKTGFFNMNCPIEEKKFTGYDGNYNVYFNSWNYKYDQKDEKVLEELAPGKTIFFISRNQDSPNIFHGDSELINVVATMDLLKLKPEDIVIVFLESMLIKDDPFYDLYKSLISRGGGPFYIRDLKKEYIISSAVHVPINWDSSVFLTNSFPNCGTTPGKAYKLLNDLILKYMDIPEYEDSFISDNEIYYYPKKVIDNHSSIKKYRKLITFQWRKVWPKGRTGQYRVLGNGPELVDHLANILPNDFLVRLVDTAGLTIRQQIALMRKTDYLVGIHGAGLCLSIYMSNQSILHEILPSKNMGVLTLMSALSGHRTYSDILRANIRWIEGSEYVFFNVKHFLKRVILHMKENKYFENY